MEMESNCFIVVVVFLAVISMGKGDDWLSDNFYGESCPSAEETVQRVVEKYMAIDRTLAAPLLRMNFHDCFVRVSNTHSLHPLINQAFHTYSL